MHVRIGVAESAAALVVPAVAVAGVAGVAAVAAEAAAAAAAAHVAAKGSDRPSAVKPTGTGTTAGIGTVAVQRPRPTMQTYG